MTTVTLKAGCKDNWIDLGESNQGSSGDLYTGRAGTGGTQRRVLCRFDELSDGTAPKGAPVISATLSMFLDLDSSSYQHTIIMQRLLRDWSESESTYVYWKSGEAWGSGGADQVGTDIDDDVVSTITVPASAARGRYTWTLPPFEIYKMINGIYQNYGWLIRSKTTDSPTLLRWDSSDSGNGPILTVELLYPPCGIMGIL